MSVGHVTPHGQPRGHRRRIARTDEVRRAVPARAYIRSRSSQGRPSRCWVRPRVRSTLTPPAGTVRRGRHVRPHLRTAGVVPATFTPRIPVCGKPSSCSSRSRGSPRPPSPAPPAASSSCRTCPARRSSSPTNVTCGACPVSGGVATRLTHAPRHGERREVLARRQVDRVHGAVLGAQRLRDAGDRRRAEARHLRRRGRTRRWPGRPTARRSSSARATRTRSGPS